MCSVRSQGDRREGEETCEVAGVWWGYIYWEGTVSSRSPSHFQVFYPITCCPNKFPRGTEFHFISFHFIYYLLIIRQNISSAHFWVNSEAFWVNWSVLAVFFNHDHLFFLALGWHVLASRFHGFYPIPCCPNKFLCETQRVICLSFIQRPSS